MLEVGDNMGYNIPSVGSDISRALREAEKIKEQQRINNLLKNQLLGEADVAGVLAGHPDISFEEIPLDANIKEGTNLYRLSQKFTEQELAGLRYLAGGDQYGNRSEFGQQQSVAKIGEAHAGKKVLNIMGQGMAGEEVARNELGNLVTDTETGLRKQLEQGLKDIELGGVQATKQTGAQFAERGLLRSTFAQKAFEDVQIKQLEVTGESRLQTEEAVSGLKSFKEGIEKDIENKRKQIESAETVDQLNAYANEFQFLKETEMKQKFQEELAKMQIDAQKKAFYKQMIGQTIGSAATIWAVA